jgi:molybdopterin/thiamine biosynthesis adenylyltransferase/proteasome lid subunit RPN8/RPN11
MMPTLALPEVETEKLRSALALEVETAWTATARVALNGTLLLLSELNDVPDEAYEERLPLRLSIRSSGFMSAFCKAETDPQLVPVFIHTHPGGVPRPSERDEVVDAELVALALSRTGRPTYLSVLVGGTTKSPRVTGRLWSGKSFVSLDRIRIAGPGLGVLLADDRPAGPPPAAMFDRNVRAFGGDGQRLLRALTIGVVGAGGTGSPTVEQLARLGVGKLVVVDDDSVDDTNLTRIHAASSRDIGRDKVDVAADSAEAYGTGTFVERFSTKVFDLAAIRGLASCDLVFGCTDDDAGRLVLSKLAYHYLVPVIDCGVVVDAPDGEVLGVYGRVTVVAPGAPCLMCRKRVDPERARADLLDTEERSRLAAEGYVPGIGDHAPAVVAFTTTTSGLAVTEMLARLLNFGANPAPSELLFGLHDREIHRPGRTPAPLHYCVDASQWGLGDTEPPLGLLGIF